MNPMFLPMCAGFIILNLAGIPFYSLYTGIGRGRGFLLWIVALAFAATAALLRAAILRNAALDSMEPQDPGIFTLAVCTFLFVMAAVPFAAKLLLKLAARRLTAKEKTPGMAGVRAWLGPGNLFLALCIALLGRAAFDFPVAATLGACLALVVVYPLLNIPPEPSAPGGTAAPPPATPGRMLALLGASLALLGFFLPWYRVNIWEELQSADPGGRSLLYSGILPRNPLLDYESYARVTGSQEDFMVVSGPSTAKYAGAQLRHGLGWMVLALALVAAALPYAAPRMDSQSQRRMIFLLLGVGAILLLPLISLAPLHAGIGIIFVACGYACAFVGVFKDAPRPSAPA